MSAFSAEGIRTYVCVHVHIYYYNYYINFPSSSILGLVTSVRTHGSPGIDESGGDSQLPPMVVIKSVDISGAVSDTIIKYYPLSYQIEPDFTLGFPSLPSRIFELSDQTAAPLSAWFNRSDLKALLEHVCPLLPCCTSEKSCLHAIGWLVKRKQNIARL